MTKNGRPNLRPIILNRFVNNNNTWKTSADVFEEIADNHDLEFNRSSIISLISRMNRDGILESKHDWPGSTKYRIKNINKHLRIEKKQKKIAQNKQIIEQTYNQIIDVLKKCDDWKTATEITVQLGMDKKHTGRLTSYLKKLSNNNTIISEYIGSEYVGGKYVGGEYRHRYNQSEADTDNPPQEEQPTPTNKNQEEADTGTPPLEEQPTHPHKSQLAQKLTKLGIEMRELNSDPLKFCCEKMEAELKTLRKQHHTTRIEKEIEILKSHTEKPSILTELVNKENEISDLKDKINAMERADMVNRAHTERITKKQG